jgi:hypothetical protein
MASDTKKGELTAKAKRSDIVRASILIEISLKTT